MWSHCVIEGLTLRTVGSLWRDAVDLAMAHELLEVEEQQDSPSQDGISDEEEISKRRLDIRVKYFEFLARLEKKNLGNVWEMRPMFDGESMCESFEMKPGPTVGRLLQDQIEWQLEHPGASKQHCWHWLSKHITSTV